MVSSEGVRTDVRKVSAVREFPVPANVTQLRSFLGLASYYRRFIEGYATIAKPLHSLTGKNVPFSWTQQCQEAFMELKERLTTSPVLVFPDYTRPFILETDASGVGLGAVLAQKQEEPIAFASRTLWCGEKVCQFRDGSSSSSVGDHALPPLYLRVPLHGVHGQPGSKEPIEDATSLWQASPLGPSPTGHGSNY